MVEGKSKNILPVTQWLEQSVWGDTGVAEDFLFCPLSGLAAGLLLFVRHCLLRKDWSVDGARTAGVDGWGKAMSVFKQKRKRVPRGEQLQDLHRHSTTLSSLDPFSPLPWLWEEAQKPLPGDTLCLTSLSSFDEKAVGVMKTTGGCTSRMEILVTS